MNAIIFGKWKVYWQRAILAASNPVAILAASNRVAILAASNPVAILAASNPVAILAARNRYFVGFLVDKLQLYHLQLRQVIEDTSLAGPSGSDGATADAATSCLAIFLRRGR